MSGPLLSARALSHRYPAPRGAHRSAALDSVDLDLLPGETVGLVGRSGSGKSTLLKLLLALDSADTGTVTCQGKPVRPGPTGRLRWFRRLVQYVPQDPATSLDPRASAAALVLEPLLRLGIPGTVDEHRERVRNCLEQLGIGAALHSRRPGELSGGQTQRVAIARALVARPLLLVADEPVSGLDLPLRAQVVQVLREVCDTTGLLLVSHDLSVVAGLCARTLVMHDGKIVEDRPSRALLRAPEHPQTRLLLESVPRLPEPSAPPVPAPPVPSRGTHP